METIVKNLDALMAFHVVAKEGSFTRAAERLGTSKAMLSKQVMRLESYLRAPLFHRTTRRIGLTEYGSTLLSYSERIFDLSSEAGRRLRDLGELTHAGVKIAMPISFGEVLGPSFLRFISERLPHFKVEMDLANESLDFIHHELDFAVRADDEHHPDLIAKPLGRLRDVICASSSYKGMQKAGNIPQVLSELECITHSGEASWNTWTLVSDKNDTKVKVSGRFSSNQYSAIRSMALAGLGFARLPKYIVEEDLKEGRLIEYFPEYLIATHSLFLVYMKTQYASKKQNTVKEHLLNWFKQRKDIFV